MKSRIFLALVLCAITGSQANAQFAFGVSPGLNMNRAYFGFKMNRFVPFMGVQYMSTSATYQYEHEWFDYDLNAVVPHNHNDEYKVSLLMPNLGLKYFIKETGNLKAHLTLNVVKPVVNARMINDGNVDEDVREYVRGLSIWGGEFSFGAEYFFDEHFSVGGEFGMRYIRFKFEDTDQTTVYNPVTGVDQPSESTYRMKLNMSPTFSKISLNYYF